MLGLASFQAVVLAGGEDKRLAPLTSGVIKALLPVGNKPLLSYPLKLLQDAGLKHAFVVVHERAAAAIQSWISAEQASLGSLQCEVVTVPEADGTADALRAVAPKISAKTLVVLSGDLLTDVPVNALVATHQMNSALATVMLNQRKVSPASETKPGKPPKNVDYIGLSPSRDALLFYASSPDAMRDLRVPLGVVRKYGAMHIASDLSDSHCYVFDRSILDVLGSNPQLASLRQDLLPHLTQQQFRMRPLTTSASSTALDGAARQRVPSATGVRPASQAPSRGPSHAGSDGEDTSEAGSDQRPEPLAASDYMTMTHGASSQQAEGRLRVHVVQGGSYCARVADVQSYAEVNREVADPGVALHLTGLKPSRHENIVGATSTIGNKATIAAGCIVGEGCAIGDKSSIKRSVLGNNCKIGVNVKIVGSVLMDGVVVGDGCTVQNTVMCSGSQLKEKATVKDCQVGPSYVVAGGVEYKDEVLAKQGAQK